MLIIFSMPPFFPNTTSILIALVNTITITNGQLTTNSMPKVIMVVIPDISALHSLIHLTTEFIFVCIKDIKNFDVHYRDIKHSSALLSYQSQPGK